MGVDRSKDKGSTMPGDNSTATSRKCRSVVGAFEKLRAAYCATGTDSDRCAALPKAFLDMLLELCESDSETLIMLLDRVIDLAISVDQMIQTIQADSHEALSIISVINEKFNEILGGSIDLDFAPNFFSSSLALKGVNAEKERHQFIDALKALREFVTSCKGANEELVEETCATCASTAGVLEICDFDPDCIGKVTEWLRAQRLKGIVVSDAELIEKAKEIRKERDEQKEKSNA